MVRTGKRTDRLRMQTSTDRQYRVVCFNDTEFTVVTGDGMVADILYSENGYWMIQYYGRKLPVATSNIDQAWIYVSEGPAWIEEVHRWKGEPLQDLDWEIVQGLVDRALNLLCGAHNKSTDKRWVRRFHLHDRFFNFEQIKEYEEVITKQLQSK